MLGFTSREHHYSGSVSISYSCGNEQTMRGNSGNAFVDKARYAAGSL